MGGKVVRELEVLVVVVVVDKVMVVLDNHNQVFWVVREALVGKVVRELEVLVVVVVDKVMVALDNHNLMF